MQRSCHLPLLFLLLLLAACSGGRRGAMLAQLEELERQNRADSVMRNDSLARELADYFDRHGSPNERMRAHYILGRTYADMGEAPAALNSYLDAAESADTTASDCDYRTLSRVYGQMSGVFLDQNILKDYMESLTKSVNYAWRANDTVQALNEHVHMLIGYDNLQDYEHVVSDFSVVHNLLRDFYGETMAARYCIVPVRALLERGDFHKAREYLDLYRDYSGYFDDNTDIEDGREVYYYLRGLYHLYIHEYDSAKVFLRKELRYGLDFANQSMASRGLSLVFRDTRQYDSAAIYAIYSYEMNDSAYAQMATREVEVASAQHQYTRHQQLAHQEHLRAEGKARENRLLYETLAVFFVAVCFGTFYAIRKRKRVAAMLRAKIEELENSRRDILEMQEKELSLVRQIAGMEDTIVHQRDEVSELSSSGDALRKLIEEKERQIGHDAREMQVLKAHEQQLRMLVKEREAETHRHVGEVEDLQSRVIQLEHLISEKESYANLLAEELSQYKIQVSTQDFDAKLREHSKYEYYQKRLKACSRLSGHELIEIEAFLSASLPLLFQSISSIRHSLNDSQFHVCLLFRLHMDVNQTASLLGVSASYVSRISKDILKKLFNEDGNGLLLRKRLEQCAE